MELIKCIRFTPIYLALLFFSTATSQAQTIYRWNKTGAASWMTDINWTPSRTNPAANDILVFDNGAVTTLENVPVQTVGQILISNNTTINLQADVAGNVLTVAGNVPGVDLEILAGSALNCNGSNSTNIFVAAGATANITGDMVFSGAAHHLDAADAAGIVFNSPATFIQDAGCSGNVFTATGTANAVIFNSGATFIQKAGANPFALTQPLSKVVFDKGSFFKVQQLLFLSFSGRTYGNLEINYPGFNQVATGVNPLTLQDLTITQGTLSFTFTGGINLKGNVYVAPGAALNFNPAVAGPLYFNGTALQNITNSGTLSFNNQTTVHINNAAGIKINSDLTFNNIVYFDAGIALVPNPNIFTFGSLASASNVSNNSFIDGMVKKEGNTAFTFPVGKSGTGYVPVKISAPALPTDAYTAEYRRTGAVALSNNYTAGLDHVSGVDYWVVNRSRGTSAVDITLYWTNESSFNGAAFYINNISKLVIAHYDGNTQWDNFGGTYDAGSGFAAGSITWNNVNDFSAFSLASIDVTNPLPVKLIYFDGIKQGNKNILGWKVDCATSVTMNVEKSTDGINFFSIKKIDADAEQCLYTLNYTDELPVAGTYYYRLKMTDANNKTSYSPAIVLLAKKSSFTVTGLMPNVISSHAILNVAAAQNTIVGVVLNDVNGCTIQRYRYSLHKGINGLMLQLSNLPGGVYFLNVIDPDGIPQTMRLIKQ